MKQADVQSLFLKQFSGGYPGLSFRNVKMYPGQSFAPYDLAMRVCVGQSGVELDLLVVILGEGYPKDVERLLARVAEAPVGEDDVPRVPVLVAPYFRDESLDLCRNQGVGCFDLAGNVLLDAPNVYYWVSGCENAYLRERQANSPFRGKAERVVRRMLIEDDQRWSMRRLAQAAQVSLGLTSGATSALAEMGLVTKTRQGMDLYNRGGLLDAWSDEYDVRLSNFCVYHSALSPRTLAKKLGRGQPELASRCALTFWSGASALLEGGLDGERLAFYYDGPPENVAQACTLSETQDATSVFVFQPYDASLLWDARETDLGMPCVHPLQLYLDLNAGDADELALAQKVRRQLLRR